MGGCKGRDEDTVPLCDGPGSCHDEVGRVGEAEFNRRHGCDLEATMYRLRELVGAEECEICGVSALDVIKVEDRCEVTGWRGAIRVCGECR